MERLSKPSMGLWTSESQTVLEAHHADAFDMQAVGAASVSQSKPAVIRHHFDRGLK